MALRITRVAALDGSFRPPSDKSITHRGLLLGAIARTPSEVAMPLRSEDAEATENCLRKLGVEFEWAENRVKVIPREWMQPSQALYCGNSGTTMRLLSGLVASRDLDCVLGGDASLSRRPMGRIAEPLRLMGAGFEGDTPPIRIRGAKLQGISYRTPVASAQIKSCILLAGLRAEGETWVEEPSPSRDHTERMLEGLGVPVSRGVRGVGLQAAVFDGFNVSVPGDISSAAFLLCAAALVPGSRVEAVETGINVTRSGLLDVFRASGVRWSMDEPTESGGEPRASLLVQGGAPLRSFEIGGSLVPRLIDEIPVLAVLATQAQGVTTIRDARELRVKESDRIALVTEGLRAMGARIEATEDGMVIEGPTPLSGTSVAAHGDHRIAMAFAVAGLIAEGETVIEGEESIRSSYPCFLDDLNRLAVW